MTIDEGDDPKLAGLRRLLILEPEPARAERVRARCLAALAQRRSKAEGSTARAGFATRVLEPVLVAGFCATYLFALLQDVLRLHGVR
jgi:hypothetical protein